ncbi:MAG: hypothetical protein WBP11_07770 [Dokdonella sp.]
MKKNSLTTAVVAGIAGVAGFAGLANAVHLNPDGLGQVLLYPYYTVNNGQQTLLSVVNTAPVAKAIKVRFLEGYNSREVLDFNLFLSPYDVWTATIFALRDDGKDSDAAGILTRDRSCTAPLFSEDGTNTSDGTPYVTFREFAYLMPSDGGPTTIDRTREGHFEMITMADLSDDLAAAVTHSPPGGSPADCDAVRNLQGGEAGLDIPTSGIFGGAGIVNGGQGTFYTYNADALDRFTQQVNFTATNNVLPNLANVNDGIGPVLGAQATANVFTGTGVTTSVYPGADPRSRRVDAVSAIFTADAIYNEFQTATSIGANSDWVVTFPTKAFYVDALFGGSPAIPPFTRSYNGSASAGVNRYSCVAVGLKIYDQEEKTPGGNNPGFSPPPPGAPPSSLCKETNVISFLNVNVAPTSSGVLGSTLITNVNPAANGAAGWLRVNFDATTEPHAMLAATNGNVFRGLPVTGFYAMNIVNSNVTVIDGVQATLANYSGVFNHRKSRNCVNGSQTAQFACS